MYLLLHIKKENNTSQIVEHVYIDTWVWSHRNLIAFVNKGFCISGHRVLKY